MVLNVGKNYDFFFFFNNIDINQLLYSMMRKSA